MTGVNVTMAQQWTGREARLLRQSLRLSVRSFAEYLGVGARTISKWEAAGAARSPRPEFQAILDTALAQATADQQTRFAETAGLPHPSDSERPGARHSQSAAPSSADTSPENISWLPRLNVNQLREFGETLDEAGQQTEGEVAAFFGRKLIDCQARDGDRGPVDALPSALSVIAAMESSARRVSLPVRRELLCLAARGSEFTGWLYRDAGAFDQAAYWYDRAVEWAQEAGNAPLQGYVLLRRSQMAYDLRDSLRTLTLAQAAQEGPWQMPLRMRAEVAQQLALGMAVTGESAVTVVQKVNDARGLLSRAATDDDSSALLGASFTDATLDLRVSVCYIEVGWPSRAASLLSDVIATGNLSRRDEGFFQARHAVALSLCDEPDEAARVGLASLDAANTTHSQRTRRVLGEVVGRLAPWGNRPAVQMFREAVGH